jgi:signal transduction histidine kinase
MNDPSLITNIAHPEDRFMVENHYNEEVKCVDKNWSFEFRIINCYGDERWISHSCRPIFNAEGKWIGQRGSNRDISEQKNAEKAMLASQQQLRALTKKMDALAEEERTRIAREIHDELGHLLTAMKFDIESITENEDLAPDSFKEKMDPILSMVDALIDSVRKIASDLRPGILDHLGLFPAIEWQINQFQMRTRIKCHYELKADIKFDKNETIIIYHILQEILTNVARHSKAKSLRISLVKSGSRFTMKVQDDGIGFDWNSDIYRNSFGLMGMRERAMSIGGELVIESFIGKGTTVIFELIIK